MNLQDLNIFYGDFHAVKSVSLGFHTNKVTALIGPSGCGKSTLLRSLNRLNELQEGIRVSGLITLDGTDIHSKQFDVNCLRRRVGMVFQKANPFPMSVFDNIAYGPRVHGEKRKSALSEIVENSLLRVGLFEELKDRLRSSAASLSGGQMQRLCIARAIAVNPDVLLMDEPTSALDPGSSAVVESLIKELSKTVSIVIVTHNMQQAARVSDMTAFMFKGELIESDRTGSLFQNPRKERTKNYISGLFG